MKKIISLIMVLFSIACLVGCNEEKKVGLQRIYENKELIIGFTEYPPFGYMEDGEYKGFDLELAKLVCDELGITFKAKYIDWESMKMELESNCDCIWNALTITEDRKQNMIFTKPYWETNLVAVVNNDSEISSIDTLIGKTIAVETSGTADINLSENENYTLARFTKVSEALLALKSESVDALVADATYVTDVLEKYSSDYKRLDGVIGDVERYGIGFRIGEEDLKDKVDEIIDSLYEQGKLDTLLEKYFGETNGFYR